LCIFEQQSSGLGFVFIVNVPNLQYYAASMMYYFSELNQVTNHEKWLSTCLPSCNDNNDPDHDSSVSAAEPRGKIGASAISCDLWLAQTRLVRRS
jgi:hypothetical protein